MLIRSWAELQDRITSIVETLNRNLDLAVAAAVNPFFVLEEIGLEVVPEARPEIEERLRFPPQEATRLSRLRKLIFDKAGREFDLQSADELHRVLFEELSIEPYPDERGCIPKPPDTHPLPRIRVGDTVTDPLSVLEGRHPIMEPLLTYRRLEATQPRFAPRSAYEEIRQGKRSHGIRALRIRLRRQQDGERRRAPSRGDSSQTAAATAETPLDINTASAAELTSLLGIGAKLASRIVAYREEHGPFETRDALMQVAGIGERLLASIRSSIRTQT